ncbi:MAG: GtrA family protein [Chlorobium sp.]|nr:GtrA family protein [Chlorobium sp.]
MFLRQAGRYLLSGGMLTVVGYAAIILLSTVFGLDPYWANFYVYVAGIIVSYWLNALIVFRNRPNVISFLKFLFSFLIAYAANIIALAVALDWMHLGHWLSQLLATVVYSCVHFGLSRTYVFKWKIM